VHVDARAGAGGGGGPALKFIFHSSASTTDGTPQHERYLQVIDEAVAAEQAGFDVFSVGEQHFNTDGVTQICCPEVAARTSTLRLQWSSVVLLDFNHPLRTAERIATLDALSGGRLNVCTARSNHKPTLDAFEIPLEETRAQWAEGLELVVRALTEDEFDFEGSYWSVPRVSLAPKPVQSPHPPLYYAATSIDGLRIGAGMGLGVMIGNSLPGGWDYVAECGEAYNDLIASAEPVGAYVNRDLVCSVMTAHCAESMEQARAEAESPARWFVDLVIRMFQGMAESGVADYAYMDNIRSVVDRKDDMDYLNTVAPYISVGDPDFLVERFERLESLGYDAVILRIDGMGHETNLRSLELFGKYVIPEFR
jgi:alkanesulfonate monooxygenase SsuD/methylene tetrahydromethanopterin reductase-like flavin-dependent oxidoreductase (luciferase family)